MREKIELSGRDARWEFPKGPLFGRTNYMADICGTLAEMVEVVDDFFKFLGPELKAVTGEIGCFGWCFACFPKLAPTWQSGRAPTSQVSGLHWKCRLRAMG